ncbi:hypothetical protein H8K35_00165 [Undibacterium sp. LX40W]|uniref:Uncharacterized protein n=1 Tax=Undibacterium nitidum TaxID=2762298 RepID=A0A923HMP8_9BURK|nr:MULTISPECIES: hypothetical protein [Undibacterium]MBC3881203.1 hypothetical protein [Undibacterium nitidum]MBC3890064.1 hypothetical protein [Undibacterium sp. LX40W]
MKRRLISFFKLLLMFLALIALVNSTRNVVSPWKGEDAARAHMQNYLPLAIGGSFVGWEIQSQSYLLIPLSFSNPKMLFVEEMEDGSFTVESDQISFWLFGAFIAYGWYLMIISVSEFVRANRKLGRGATKT